jgi:hypothetical protein
VRAERLVALRGPERVEGAGELGEQAVGGARDEAAAELLGGGVPGLDGGAAEAGLVGHLGVDDIGQGLDRHRATRGLEEGVGHCSAHGSDSCGGLGIGARGERHLAYGASSQRH